MRIWHQKLIPLLDRQRLLGQHRELCALRGRGWGRKHATVDYVFEHFPDNLVAYHYLVMNEMKRRGYKPDEKWYNCDYRGAILGVEKGWTNPKFIQNILLNTQISGEPIYFEHDDAYLNECLNNLKEKGVYINENIDSL